MEYNNKTDNKLTEFETENVEMKFDGIPDFGRKITFDKSRGTWDRIFEPGELEFIKRCNLTKGIYNIKYIEDLGELEKINKLNELVVGIPNKKSETHDLIKNLFCEYLCDTNKLSNTDINSHFMTQLKLINWIVSNTTIGRNGDLMTLLYLTVQLPMISNPEMEALKANLKLPRGIKKMYLYNELITILDTNIISQLDELEELYIYMKNFNLPLDNLPSRLKILSICSDEFNQPVNNLPENLQYLYINSYSFNNNLDCLPSGLKVLSICSLNFSHELNNLPLGLEILHLNINNRLSCSFNYLPETLICLYLSGSYIKSDLANLPIGLEVLYVETNESENTSLVRYNNLPPNIKQKSIRCRNQY